MTHFFSIKSIQKSFAEKVVLRDVSLEIFRGQMVCILGPSGCGKTTLLRCLAGLESPNHGSIIFEGSDITNIPAQKRHFGFVFQNYALFPNLTVAANIAYGLRGAAWTTQAKRKRVQELLSLIGLPEYVDHYPFQLSGGQQQRVSLARALAPSPSLLFLDEPFSALDAQVRHQLREDFRVIQRNLGITAILVTHDQQEALTIADRIVVMREGQVEQDAAPDGLYHTPASHFVAQFIGAMNVLSLPCCNNGNTFGIRYEDVHVHEATELALMQPYTVIARLESCRLFGAFHRLELVLQDQRTKVYADLPPTSFAHEVSIPGALVAISFPESQWRVWEH